jgi:hypothetical protein
VKTQKKFFIESPINQLSNQQFKKSKSVINLNNKEVNLVSDTQLKESNIKILDFSVGRGGTTEWRVNINKISGFIGVGVCKEVIDRSILKRFKNANLKDEGIILICDQKCKKKDCQEVLNFKNGDFLLFKLYLNEENNDLFLNEDKKVINKFSNRAKVKNISDKESIHHKLSCYYNSVDNETFSFLILKSEIYFPLIIYSKESDVTIINIS